SLPRKWRLVSTGGRLHPASRTRGRATAVPDVSCAGRGQVGRPARYRRVRGQPNPARTAGGESFRLSENRVQGDHLSIELVALSSAPPVESTDTRAPGDPAPQQVRYDETGADESVRRTSGKPRAIPVH